jgi:hypothetical protein
MSAARTRWFSLATLVVYLTINVAVSALHHHAISFAQERTAVLTAATADAADADEHPCPICSVLHQFKPFTAPVSTLVAVIERGAVTPPVFLPPISSWRPSTRSRAPPA